MKTSTRRRYERLARQLVIHGRRLAGSDEDFIGGIKTPAAMSEADMIVVYNWMTSTPQRWHFTAMVRFCPPDKKDYDEVVSAVTSQACLVNSLSEWRMGLLEQAKGAGNHHQATEEFFEYRLARKEDYYEQAKN